MPQKGKNMENISKNALFQNVSIESIEKMMPCFEMKKRNFAEKDIIPTVEGTKEYICLLLEGAVSVSRISIDGSLDLLEYMEDTGVFGDAAPVIGWSRAARPAKRAAPPPCGTSII